MLRNKLFVFVAAFAAIVISVGFFYGVNSDDKDRLTTSSYPVILSNETDVIPGMGTGANMPTYSYHGGDFNFTRNDTGWIFFVGGDLTGAGVLSQKNDRYNVKTNTWTTMAPYPTPPGIWYTDGASLGSKGYICGGLTGSFLSNTTAALLEYDINANTWTTKASMPAPRAMGQLVGYQDSILYWAAGFDASGTSQSNVYIYNNIANTWRVATSLPGTRMGGALARSGDTLVFVDGTTGVFNGTTTNTTYVGLISQSDRSVITWTTKAPYPGIGRYRQKAETWSCKGIIISGGTSAAGYTPAVGEVYRYSPGADVWTVQPSLITTRTAHMTGAVSVGSNIWKFVNVCGFNGANVLTTDILTDTLLCAAPQLTACRNNLNIPIPDNSTARDSVFVNLGGCTITDVNVRIDTVLHTWDSDLNFFIQRGNVGALVINHVGGSGDNFIGTVLDDEATTPIASGTAPFTGSFIPSNPLTVFDGAGSSAYWRILITDTAGGDTGTLKAWCLVISYNCPTGGVKTIEVPNYYFLNQNYPNPFNPTTTIKFGMPRAENVKLVVYDILGREVKTLINEFRSSGVQEVTFDATNFSSGVYFYKIETANFTQTKRMLLVK